MVKRSRLFALMALLLVAVFIGLVAVPVTQSNAQSATNDGALWIIPGGLDVVKKITADGGITIPATNNGGVVTTNGTAVGAGVCQAQPALTVTGTATTSQVVWSVPTALPATWQTGIQVVPVVTANTVTLSLCNGTAGSITPVAQGVNVRVLF